MKKIFLRKFIFLIIFLICVFSLYTNNNKAEAAIPPFVDFSGRIATVEICANGILFWIIPYNVAEAQLQFIFPWQYMVPTPLTLGTGLYSWWSIAPTEKVLGTAHIGGTCHSIYTFGIVPTPVEYTVIRMGTTLIPSIP